MSAIFAGSSRAALTSAAFAVETTGRIEALVPILSGTFVSLFISWILTHYSIMTEKIHRKGQGVRTLFPDYVLIQFRYHMSIQ
jgi:H+/Cl- antiporter ClcA